MEIKREDDDRTDVDYTIIYPRYIPSMFDILKMYSHPVPSRIHNGTMITLGGLRFGGRYPDIIIDDSDYSRAKKILEYKFPKIEKGKSCPISLYGIKEIVSFVRRIFKTDLAVKFQDEGEYVGVSNSWNSTIDKSTDCFVKKTYECNDLSECKKNKQKYKNTMTNITLLQYLIGDCREHAWLSGYLSTVFHTLCCHDINNCKRRTRIFYTKVYAINDLTKHIKYIEDHVFVLYYNGENITIIDPLYVNNKSIPRIEYNNMIGKNVNISSYYNYEGIENIVKDLCFYQNDNSNSGNKYQPSIVMECGRMIRSDGTEFKLINIPILYNGEMKVFHNKIITNNEEGLLMNRLVKIKNLKRWENFDDWCDEKILI